MKDSILLTFFLIIAFCISWTLVAMCAQRTLNPRVPVLVRIGDFVATIIGVIYVVEVMIGGKL